MPHRKRQKRSQVSGDHVCIREPQVEGRLCPAPVGVEATLRRARAGRTRRWSPACTLVAGEVGTAGEAEAKAARRTFTRSGPCCATGREAKLENEPS